MCPKNWAFVVLAWVMFTFASSIADGEVAFIATKLTAPTTPAAASVEVQSASGFLASGGIWMGDEYCTYTGKDATHFTGLTRGVTYGTQTKTTAFAHISGTKVYSRTARRSNALLSFNIAQVAAEGGSISAITGLVWSFVVSIPSMLLWDYSFFVGELVMLRILLMGLSVAFLWPLLMSLLQLGQTILRR